MIHKKLLSLLVLLVAAVSGAWADELATEYTSDATLNAVTVSEDMEITIASGATVTVNNGLTIASGKTLTVNGPGTLVVNGTTGASGNNGSDGEDGGAAISGNIAVYGATVQATGGNGGKGGDSNENPGGIGGNAGAAFSGAVTIYSGKIIAQGGIRGNGGDGNDGPGQIGESSAAFSGTLTFFGGTVEATSGDNFADAFANNMIMKASTYELVGGDNAGSAAAIDVNAITNSHYVKITASDFAGPDYAFSVADCEHGTGKIAFYIDGNKVDFAMQADEGKTITMTITPDEGWAVDVDNVKAQAYTTWANAGARRRRSAPANIQILGDIEFTSGIPVDEQGVATFTFTMPTASVLVTPAFQKISTLYFDPADRTNLMEIKVGDDKVNVEDNKTVKIEKVERVLEGTPVKLTANTGYKFRKVEVKKKAAEPVATLTTAPTPNDDCYAGDDLLLTKGTAEGGTLMFKVTTTNVKPTSTEGFSTEIPKGVENDPSYKNYIWYYIKGDDTHSDSEIFGPIEVTLVTT